MKNIERNKLSASVDVPEVVPMLNHSHKKLEIREGHGCPSDQGN